MWITGIFSLSGVFWYCIFYQKEKRLLNRLQQMLDCAIDGELERTEISEEKYSALENSMKQYLDSNFLARKNQQEQKEVIQKLISDIAHQTLKVTENVEAVAWCNVDDAKGYIFQSRPGGQAQYILTEFGINGIQGMKKDKNKEITKLLASTAYNTLMGYGLTSEQGLIFTGGMTVLDVMNLDVEIDKFNEKIDDETEKIEIGTALNALGVENVALQFHEDQVHIEVSLCCKETYERLYAYYKSTTSFTNDEIREKIEKILEKWTKKGLSNTDDKLINDYTNWFFAQSGETIFEDMREHD